MKWTDEMRTQLRRMHAQGCSDREIAEHFGFSRNLIANYRGQVLNLPANTAKLRPCDVCGLLCKNVELHKIKMHKVQPRTPEQRHAVRLKAQVKVIAGMRIVTESNYIDCAGLLDRMALAKPRRSAA